MERRRGFTILELILVIAIVGLLLTAVVVLINPPKQFAKANNGARSSHLGVILGAISENMSDHKGSFDCTAGSLPATSTKMAVGGGNYDIGPCLVPAYLSSGMPYDPTASGAHYSSTTDYDTGYTVARNASTGQITLAAPGAELGQTIILSR